MVVGPDGKVTPRAVKIGSAVDGEWLVVEGLSAGDQVMVDGFQKLRGNAPVKPVPWRAGAAASAGAAGPTAAASAAPATAAASAPASAAGG
jgi:membrane fusion protein (multidrug efflux system)